MVVNGGQIKFVFQLVFFKDFIREVAFYLIYNVIFNMEESSLKLFWDVYGNNTWFFIIFS